MRNEYNNHNKHNHFDHSHDHDGRFHHDPSGESHGGGRGGRGFRGAPGFGAGGSGFGSFGQGFGKAFGPGFEAGFGPRGPRRASKGDIRSAILSLLSEGPSNGYGLIKAIAEKTDDAWRPSPGSVYPTLQQLVDEELIASSGDGRKTEFELTDAGKAYVEEHSDDFAKAWKATAGRSETSRELVEGVGKLMSVVGQFRHGTTEAQRAAALEKIDETRRALYLILAD